MRRACVLAALALCGCGSSAVQPGAARGGGPALVAALGDSITAGSPLWDPDPSVRAQIGPQLNGQSQYEYWAAQRLGRAVTFRNCGVFGERTDQIAQRLEACGRDARYLIVQGGINDIAQGRSTADAAANLRSIVRRGKAMRLRVALVEVLPWNNGYPTATPQIAELNARIRQIGRAEGVEVLPWYHALEDPAKLGRMRSDLTIDGDHPSIAGYRELGKLVTLP